MKKSPHLFLQCFISLFYHSLHIRSLPRELTNVFLQQAWDFCNERHERWVACPELKAEEEDKQVWQRNEARPQYCSWHWCDFQDYHSQWWTCIIRESFRQTHNALITGNRKTTEKKWKMYRTMLLSFQQKILFKLPEITDVSDQNWHLQGQSILWLVIRVKWKSLIHECRPMWHKVFFRYIHLADPIRLGKTTIS